MLILLYMAKVNLILALHKKSKFTSQMLLSVDIHKIFLLKQHISKFDFTYLLVTFHIFSYLTVNVLFHVEGFGLV